MNKILILDPFYSNFHRDLATSLSEDVYSLVFNLGNIVYLHRTKKQFAHRKILDTQHSSDDIYMVNSVKSLYSETSRKLLNRELSENNVKYMAKFAAYIRVFLFENKINLVLMHNDLRWQHALAIQVCKELGIRYLITERGIFRPDTTTVELLGVNAYSSLPKDADFYRSLDIPQISLKSYKVSKFTNTRVNIKFLLFIVLNKIGDILGVNCPLKNKRYQIRNYLNLFIQQSLSFRNRIPTNLPDKYIFIPLQVNTDTQLLVHSDYNNMQEFISQVEKAFYAMDSDIKLVFKVHPMERKKGYLFDMRSVVTDANTKQLVKNSEFVVTINSTVGFEAMQAYKNVIVVGSAFYKIEGMVICSSIESFKDDLRNCLNIPPVIDQNLIIKFIRYLQSEYQINGNLFNYDTITLSAVRKKLESNKRRHKSLLLRPKPS